MKYAAHRNPGICNNMLTARAVQCSDSPAQAIIQCFINQYFLLYGQKYECDESFTGL
jgi:hypothetical protein